MDIPAVRAGLLGALGLVALACASGAPGPPSQVLDTRVRDPAIEVDGYRADWEGDLTRVGDRDVFAGFHREGDLLYVAVVSQDPGFDARVFTGGLTVWVDTAGRRRRRYGVRHPVFDAEVRERLRADTAGPSPGRRAMLDAAGSTLVLVRDGEAETRSGSDPGGVRVATAIDRGLFTYELRLPLGAGAGGPGLPAGDTISVGLVAGGDQGRAAADTTAGVAPEEAAPDTAAPGRRRPDRGRGARGPGPAPRRGGPPALEIWVRVTLDGGG